jgi:hypothetical protein
LTVTLGKANVGVAVCEGVVVAVGDNSMVGVNVIVGAEVAVPVSVAVVSGVSVHSSVAVLAGAVRVTCSSGEGAQAEPNRKINKMILYNLI